MCDRRKNGAGSFFLLFGMLVALLLVVDLGCERRAATFTVGTIGPRSGNNASWCEIQKHAFTIAADEINTSGGINGAPFILIDEYTQDDPRTAAIAFNKLVDRDRVLLVIGSPESDTTLALAPIANSKKIVLLSTGSGAAEAGNAGPYIFGIMPSDGHQARMTAEWMTSRGYRRIAVLYVENTWGRGLMESMVSEFKKLGGDVASVQGSNLGERDFRAQLSKIKASSSTAVYAPLCADSAAVMLRQAKELDVRTQIFGADVYANPALIKEAGDASEGVLFTRHAAYQGKEYQDFAEKYRKKFGKEPETFAAYCYDVVRIAAQTLSKCNGNRQSSDCVRNALLGLNDYKGASGLASFKAGSSASANIFEKLVIQGGRFVPVS